MSPRPQKKRNCSCRIKGLAFKPTGTPMSELEQIQMRHDELEALKLCDLDGLDQAEAGIKMGVSRGTIQRILASARRKTAEAISGRKALVFEES